MARIQCSDVGKSYGSTRVISGFDLEVADHEFVVFLGPSGCGKSTILRMIAGLEEISEGTVSIDGIVVNDLEPRERGVAMVFQNYALYPHMTIRDNIAFGLRRMRVPAAEIDDRIAEVAELLGLKPYLERRPAELSGGQQQRAAIARAIVKTPRVFLFDEPLSNLDAKLRNHMRVEIARLHQRLRTTTVYVTHDQLEAMTLADRIVLLNAGRIEQVGRPEEIYERPTSLFVAGFIGSPAMNFIDVAVERDGAGWALVSDMSIFRIGASRFDLQPGSRAILGVRPADLRLVASDSSANILEGTADLIEFHGDGVLVSFAYGDREVSALVSAGNAPAERSHVCFALAEDRIHLFGADHGRTLRRRQSADLDAIEPGRVEPGTVELGTIEAAEAETVAGLRIA